MRTYWKHILISAIIVVYLLFLYAPLVYLHVRTRPETVNMMVGHYFEDYYEYLSFVVQGQQRKSALENLFTTDDPVRFYIPWWPYLAGGWISSFSPWSMSPMAVYWTMAILLCGVKLVLEFSLIREVFKNESFDIQVWTFLLSLFSSSVFTISLTQKVFFEPVAYWGSLGSPFARHSIGTPHHLAASIVAIASLLMLGKAMKRFRLFPMTGILLGCSLLLLTLSSAQLILMILGYTVFVCSTVSPTRLSDWRYLQSRMIGVYPLVMTVLILFPLILLLKRFVSLSPTLFNAIPGWDLQNISYLSVGQFLLGSGALFFIAPAGMVRFLRSRDPIAILALSVWIISLCLMLFPVRIGGMNILEAIGVHNGRFASPILVPIAAVLTVSALRHWVHRKQWIILPIVLIGILNIPSLAWFFRQQTQDAGSYSIFYMPISLYRGIQQLEALPEKSILASPDSYLGLIIPALTGKQVFFGRPIFTLDIEKKREKTNAFYAGLFSSEEAKSLFRDQNIGWVVRASGDPDVTSLESAYPFLSRAYQNDAITVWEVKE